MVPHFGRNTQRKLCKRLLPVSEIIEIARSCAPCKLKQHHVILHHAMVCASHDEILFHIFCENRLSNWKPVKGSRIEVKSFSNTLMNYSCLLCVF